MRLFAKFLTAAAMLTVCIATQAATLDYTVTGNNNTYTFSLDTNPPLSDSSGRVVTDPVTVTEADASTFLSSIQFASPGNGAWCNFYFDGKLCDSSSNNYFTGTTSAPTLLAGTWSFTDLYGNGTFTVVATAVSTTPEPSSMVLLGTGILGLAGLARRKLSVVSRVSRQSSN